jgi:serine/threonine-protein phosphatase 2B regulatory subunit
MGQSQSLGPAQLESLQSLSPFSELEIKRLYSRFIALDKVNAGKISLNQLINLPELAINPLSSRLITVFSHTAPDYIDFQTFIKLLSVFSLKTPRKYK